MATAKKVFLKKCMAAVKKLVGPKKEIMLTYIYGSTATGKAHEKSDVDIGIVLKKGKEYGLHDIASLGLELQKHIGREVDVHVFNGADIRFVHEALNNAICAFARSENSRQEFEAMTLSIYLDVKPHIEEYDIMVRDRLTA